MYGAAILIGTFIAMVIAPERAVAQDLVRPSVTINQAGSQADPTASSPITFTVVFSESVVGFATGDVTFGGTAGATAAVVTGSGANYNIAVSGMQVSGTVFASIPAGVATDAAGNPNLASNSSDNTVTYSVGGVDIVPPSATINQAAGQADPTASAPITFTVVFSEPVVGFATGDIAIGGTAGATTAVVTGSGANYNVAVSGMQVPGTVFASIPAGVATDAAGNPNLASNSSDNAVTFSGPIVAPPSLQARISRKVHGSAGTFDLPLSTVAGNPSTEPRAGGAGGNHTIVFRFDKTVTAGTASVTSGAVTAGTPAFSGNEMIIPLSGVTNSQYVTVAASNVAGSDGSTGGAASVRIGFLLGDVSQSRVVTVSDLAQVNAQIAQAVTAANYLNDVNASGTLTVADKGIANAQITKALPAP